MVVVKGTKVEVNIPHILAESFSTHNHEEADTMIPLHVIDAISESTLREVNVWSPDTDVLILLMDLVAHDTNDWGGKFVGISKKSWIKLILQLPNDDPIVSAFALLGEGVLSGCELQNDD